MGTYTEILEHDITTRDPEAAKRILDKYEFYNTVGFYVSGNEIVPDECYFYENSGIYLLLAALSKVAEGRIMLKSGYDCSSLWIVELRDGKVIEHESRIIYMERESVSLPEEITEDFTIVNDRYLAAVVQDNLIIYDEQKGEWFRKKIRDSIDDLEIFNDLYHARNISQFITPCKTSEISDMLEEFVEKITKKKPELASEIEKKILAGTI